MRIQSSRVSLLAAAAAVLTASAFGQANDTCASSALLFDGVPVAFDNTNASTTTPFSCGTGVTSDLWYAYFTTEVNAQISIETCGSSFNTVLEVFQGTSCTNLSLLDCNDDACGSGSAVNLTVPTPGTLLVFRVGGSFGDFGQGTIVLTETGSPCSGQNDDAFEDNDTCATATPLAAGTYPGLVATLTDSDHYSVTLPPFADLTVILMDDPMVDLDLVRSDGACNPVVTLDQDGFVYTNNTAATEVVNFEVFVDPANAGPGCLTYEMTIDVVVPPDCSVPDALETGTDCDTAGRLIDGSYPNLNVETSDNDYYEVEIADGATLTVDIFFERFPFGNLNLYLWDPAIACDTNMAGTGSGSGALVIASSPVSDEQLIYTNTTGAAQLLILEVDMASDSCNSYDMLVDGTTSNVIGSPYCAVNPNTTGSLGLLGAFGSSLASADDVVLSASQLPLDQFAYFIASRTQGFIANPNNSQGNLCVLGNIARFNQPSQIGVTAGGTFSFQVPLNAIPEPPGASVAVMAGDTWNFQLWHRDFLPGSGPTSNFTNGHQVVFQ